MSAAKLEERADFFAALGSGRRLRIVVELRASDEPLSVSKLARAIGSKLDAVAYHVSILEKAGVVRRHHRDQVRGAVETFYVLETDASDVVDLLA